MTTTRGELIKKYGGHTTWHGRKCAHFYLQRAHLRLLTLRHVLNFRANTHSQLLLIQLLDTRSRLRNTRRLFYPVPYTVSCTELHTVYPMTSHQNPTLKKPG
ncbi:unnamed protein product [Ectocarpus sp. 12 AP-2014]